MYNYKAKTVRVIDGDTVVLDIDLGFNIHHISPCRLYGINAYELRDKDIFRRQIAKDGRDWMVANMPAEVEIVSKSLDKYGRPLVIIKDGETTINRRMLDLKLAITYLDDDKEI